MVRSSGQTVHELLAAAQRCACELVKMLFVVTAAEAALDDGGGGLPGGDANEAEHAELLSCAVVGGFFVMFSFSLVGFHVFS